MARCDCEKRNTDKPKWPVRFFLPSKPLTGPAPLRRSVCAPGWVAATIEQTAFQGESPCGSGGVEESSRMGKVAGDVADPGQFPFADRMGGGNHERSGETTAGTEPEKTSVRRARFPRALRLFLEW